MDQLLAFHIPAHPGELEVPLLLALDLLRSGSFVSLLPAAWIEADVQAGAAQHANPGHAELGVGCVG
ncbi:hypothetical protein [Deinococcus roseus]|uniref:Uncharacterized protein n=1 Tax=Deinococcus roseus TaxID=392414 RepID=A0ABQ2D0K5_9DEIO|nr:hypothetical protein [Deinococcus roseus]GGJ32657.1 hypothetical protein GCM10008938_18610 [Deinococcus roseus]